MTDSLIPDEIESERRKLRLKAMNLLARREYSATELQRKLGDSDLVPAVIARLQEDGLQSDQRFAESFLRSSLMKGRGPIRIRQEMRQKGLADSEINTAIQNAGPDWLAIASELYERKFPAPPEDQKERARRARFLAQRGFPFDIVNDLLS